VTQVEEGRGTAEAAPVALAAGAPAPGDLLAQRYELVVHISDDAVGRQVWRGIDVILRRPVAVVLRYPGGERAAEMLKAAVAASRVVHPNLVGVYDAVDEADRAFVVREWVEGASLREIVTAEGPLDPGRSTTIAHAVAAAIAAVHATGMVHGNIHPGTVLIAQDGRVVLADARADRDTTTESDVRSVGGILYFALTGHWPSKELHPAAGVVDAVRTSTGTVVAPRQMRAGVPNHLDALAVELLDERQPPRSSDLLAAELSRFDTAGQDALGDDPGALRFANDSDLLRLGPVRPAALKIGGGILALVLLATLGTLIGVRLLRSPDEAPADAVRPQRPSTSASAGVVNPRPLKLRANQVRIVDGAGGDRAETADSDKIVDGRTDTAWETATYTSPLTTVKTGIGILIDLREPRELSSIRVQFSTSGTTASLLTGDNDPGDSAAGDKQILHDYTTLTGPVKTNATWAYGSFAPNTKYRYLLVWITGLPDDGHGGYETGVQDIAVEGP